MKLLGFDIEISNVFDLRPGEDLEKYAPFDISVAATQIQDGDHRLWFTNGTDGKPCLNLSRTDAIRLLDYLDQMQRTNHALVAWNGLSFDLKWIGHVAQEPQIAARIARKMYDPMFQFFKLKGFPVSLARVAQGMGIKTSKLMDSADAPKQWRAGNHRAVCNYVVGDARMTIEIVLAIQRCKQIAWVTQRGTTSVIPLPRLKTVEECLHEPMPDQSWMDTPIPQEKFADWVTT
jgi:hypothetical protein